MTTTWVGFLTLAALVVSLLARRLAGAAVTERWSTPRELARAQLAYMEQSFRINHPIHLVAKLDRAYRLRGGALVLVELKTRWRDRPYETDIIQLSAQKLAVEVRTGQSVEPYGFISILRPTGWRALRHHRVTLLNVDEVVELHRRREAILAGRTAPRYARSRKACDRCAFRSRCDRPHDEASGTSPAGAGTRPPNSDLPSSLVTLRVE